MQILCLLIFEAVSTSTTIWFDYAKMLFVLVGVCLLALVVVKVLLPRLTGFSASAQDHIHIFARYPLEPKKTLYLVKTGKVVVVLATSGDAVHFMTTMNSEDFNTVDTAIPMHSVEDSLFRRFMQASIGQKQDKSL